MQPANDTYIHLERSEYERLTSGLVARSGLPERPSGLWVVPIPGAADYLAFPIYWPEEGSPLCRHGVQCKFESVWMFGEGALLRCACGS
jgi:hypothetical protein